MGKASGLVMNVSCEPGNLPSNAQVKRFAGLLNRKLQKKRVGYSQGSQALIS